MIQRIQTVYLIMSVVVLTVCSCLPIGSFLPEGMGAATTMYNICLIDGNTGSWSFVTVGLFVILAATVIMNVTTIFGYANRKKQMTECKISIGLLVLWMILYAVHVTLLIPEHTEYHFDFAAALPPISIIFIYLAHRGINHDEKLIRSVDRIR